MSQIVRRSSDKKKSVLESLSFRQLAAINRLISLIQQLNLLSAFSIAKGSRGLKATYNWASSAYMWYVMQRF